MIHRIVIRNFKSLREVTVELSPVTVFVGRSGTGKTNFKNAITFLRNYLSGSSESNQTGKASDIKCATNPGGTLFFEVDFDIHGFEERFQYTLHLGESIGHPPQSERLTYGSTTLFHQSHRENRGYTWDTPPALVKPPNPGQLALGRIPGLELVVVAFAALTSGIGAYSFPFHVCTQTGAVDQGPRGGLMDDGRNYLSVLKDIASNLQNPVPRRSITASLRRINPTVASVELDSLQNPQTAFVAHTLGEKTLPIELRLESDGFRRFYAHLLALYQTPPKQTLLFEEPENGIYPGALSLLADEFKVAAKTQRGQILLTTHSPTLLDHFSAGEIRVVDLENLETRVGPLVDEQREAIEEQLLHPGELLTADPARLEGQAQ